MRPYRIGTRSRTRVLACSSRMATGSGRSCGGVHCAWLERGTSPRRSRPLERHSSGVRTSCGGARTPGDILLMKPPPPIMTADGSPMRLTATQCAREARQATATWKALPRLDLMLKAPSRIAPEPDAPAPRPAEPALDRGVDRLSPGGSAIPQARHVPVVLRSASVVPGPVTAGPSGPASPRSQPGSAAAGQPEGDQPGGGPSRPRAARCTCRPRRRCDTPNLSGTY